MVRDDALRGNLPVLPQSHVIHPHPRALCLDIIQTNPHWPQFRHELKKIDLEKSWHYIKPAIWHDSLLL